MVKNSPLMGSPASLKANTGPGFSIQQLYDQMAKLISKPTDYVATKQSLQIFHVLTELISTQNHDIRL